MTVFQWHGDTYDLPDGALILARNKLYPQAFRFGSAIGIQFHLEVDRQMIGRWIVEYRNELDRERIDPQDVLPKGNDLALLAANCKAVYRNFCARIENAHERLARGSGIILIPLIADVDTVWTMNPNYKRSHEIFVFTRHGQRQGRKDL